MLPSPISEGDPPLPGPRLKAEEEPPGMDSRPFPAAFLQVHGHTLSSKSMAIPETPILRTVLHPSRYQVLLKNGGGQVLGRHWSASTLPRHLRYLAPVHLRNVRAYILFDCPRGIFADNHKKYLHDCILIVTFVCEN